MNKEEEFSVEEEFSGEEEFSVEEELINSEENVELELSEIQQDIDTNINTNINIEPGMKNYDIPKNIFLTHKSMTYINSKPELRRSVNSWLKYKKNYRIFYYDNASCDSFIKKNFSNDVYKAYQRLPMAVMKADLWRYCIIYMYGGIYTDADAECMMHPDIFTSPKTLLVCGPEKDGIHLCQWCFAAPKHSPIIKSIIDLSVERLLFINQENVNEIYIEECVLPILSKIVICGIPGIMNIYYMKENNEWYLETDGTNFKQLLGHPIIDMSRLHSNSILK
jgi:mannosyltransferase OCH1-like enzyme